MLRNDAIWLKANLICRMQLCRYEASQVRRRHTHVSRVYKLNSVQRVDRSSYIRNIYGIYTERNWPLMLVEWQDARFIRCKGDPRWFFEARKFQFHIAVRLYRDILDRVCDDSVGGKKKSRRAWRCISWM